MLLTKVNRTTHFPDLYLCQPAEEHIVDLCRQQRNCSIFAGGSIQILNAQLVFHNQALYIMPNHVHFGHKFEDSVTQG